MKAAISQAQRPLLQRGRQAWGLETHNQVGRYKIAESKKVPVDLSSMRKCLAEGQGQLTPATGPLDAAESCVFRGILAFSALIEQQKQANTAWFHARFGARK